jgi:hypothetical protein
MGLSAALKPEHRADIQFAPEGSSFGKMKIGTGLMTKDPRRQPVGKPFGRKGMADGYRCELCGEWIEYRNLSKVLAHEGPLPHVERDAAQQKRG